jgi:hypothetical protein
MDLIEHQDKGVPETLVIKVRSRVAGLTRWNCFDAILQWPGRRPPENEVLPGHFGKLTA